ncbi:molecular chaperone DnaJ [Cellvibrio sp. KY-GH-1]|uniref:molecular chaperone DnaJ n=1 Tax=Cellvibrio sp. KY-GH-1 TaxID=2303332 RepID=UPI001247E28A|nr:molecular chaperone DnaJ [Cellvibrio sp. KY-GH-1]QEY14854.1 molecular chaperone DnaJ [Cellvibrio sp. KY-GH-1]
MLKILLFAVIVTCIIIFGGRYKKMNPEQKRKALWRIGVGAFLGILILLVITGRMHWVGAALGALIPFLRNAYGLVSQLLPFWLQRKKAEQEQEQAQQQPQQPPPPTSTNQMSLSEALEILGLNGNTDKGEVTQAMVQDAHRRLIQKLHPDRGGNDYLAAKINQARDYLLSILKQ